MWNLFLSSVTLKQCTDTWSRNLRSISILRYLKLEPNIYTYMYSVFTLLCTNGEHLTSHWNSLCYTDILSKGYYIDAIYCLTNLNILLYNSEYTNNKINWKDTLSCKWLLILWCNVYVSICWHWHELPSAVQEGYWQKSGYCVVVLLWAAIKTADNRILYEELLNDYWIMETMVQDAVKFVVGKPEICERLADYWIDVVTHPFPVRKIESIMD